MALHFYRCSPFGLTHLPLCTSAAVPGAQMSLRLSDPNENSRLKRQFPDASASGHTELAHFQLGGRHLITMRTFRALGLKLVTTMLVNSIIQGLQVGKISRK